MSDDSDTLSLEPLLKAQIVALLKQGCVPSKIGFALVADPGFVVKLLNGTHKFREDTLQRAFANLHKLDDTDSLRPQSYKRLIKS